MRTLPRGLSPSTIGHRARILAPIPVWYSPDRTTKPRRFRWLGNQVKLSERKYPYRQPGEKAYSTTQASSRKLPEPKVIVKPEMRRQPAAEAVSVSGAAESSARNNFLSLE
ncbi:hypothetical protein Bbelb_373680 [Branchiostoma belcheri]|nr:hypothetical protein Bbelb_373680 [Branchiostoma belcheri]